MAELSLDKLAAVGSTPTLVRLVFHREEKRLIPKRDARVKLTTVHYLKIMDESQSITT